MNIVGTHIVSRGTQFGVQFAGQLMRRGSSSTFQQVAQNTLNKTQTRITYTAANTVKQKVTKLPKEIKATKQAAGSPEKTVNFVMVDAPKVAAKKDVNFIMLGAPKQAPKKDVNFIMIDSPTSTVQVSGQLSLTAPLINTNFVSFGTVARRALHRSMTDVMGSVRQRIGNVVGNLFQRAPKPNTGRTAGRNIAEADAVKAQLNKPTEGSFDTIVAELPAAIKDKIIAETLKGKSVKEILKGLSKQENMEILKGLEKAIPKTSNWKQRIMKALGLGTLAANAWMLSALFEDYRKSVCDENGEMTDEEKDSCLVDFLVKVGEAFSPSWLTFHVDRHIPEHKEYAKQKIAECYTTMKKDFHSDESDGPSQVELALLSVS